MNEYGVGMVFLPPNLRERNGVKTAFAKSLPPKARRCSAGAMCRRTIRRSAKRPSAAEPFMAQVFIGRNPELKDDMAFERKLYVIRKRAEQKIRYGGKIDGGKWFYVSSLSCGR